MLSKGEVWVLHLREHRVAPKVDVLVPDETTDDANTAVAAAVDMLAQAGVKAHGEVRNTIFGYAAREIINDAEEVGATSS